MKHPKLYEINTVAWLYELSQKYGDRFSIGNVPSKEWDGLKESGFHYIWLMGIWKRSQEGRRYFQTDPRYRPLYDTVLPGWKEEDIIGSPYSVASYEPDPIMGDWQDLDRVLEELHKRNMKLVLDFVPNHTGPDHPWVKDHPEYYIQGSEDDFRRNPAAFFQAQHKGKAFFIAKG
ncbi:MAG: alpha-amylase family glycosyl hydrolase, partial [Nitrospirota bacterium]